MSTQIMEGRRGLGFRPVGKLNVPRAIRAVVFRIQGLNQESCGVREY